MQKKNVVVLGGGNGSSNSIRAVKHLRDQVELSAVISMCDSGGSTGRLRTQYGVLPPSDIMRAILAMTGYDYEVLRKIFYTTKFSDAGDLDGHYLGNMFLTFANQVTGNFEDGLAALHQAVNAVGRVYPVTLEVADLCAEMSNGEIVFQEHSIDRPKKRDHHITRAWLQPTPMIYPPAKQVIEDADYIIFGPGSLYTSLIATLVVEGMKKGALRNTRAKFISIPGNSYELNGEVGVTCLSEYIETLEQYLPRPVDLIIANNSVLSVDQQQFYAQEQWAPLAIDELAQARYSNRIRVADLERERGGTCPDKLAQALKSILV